MCCSTWASRRKTAKHNAWKFRYQLTRKEWTHFLSTSQKVLFYVAVLLPSLDLFAASFCWFKDNGKVRKVGEVARRAFGKIAVLGRHHIQCGLGYGFNMRIFFLPTLFIKFVQISHSWKCCYFVKML